MACKKERDKARKDRRKEGGRKEGVKMHKRVFFFNLGIKLINSDGLTELENTQCN